MFLRIVRQSFIAGRRKLLAGVTVTLAGSLFAALLTLTVDVGDRMAQELRAYGANIEVVPRSAEGGPTIDGVERNPLRGRDFLDEQYLPAILDIFWRNNIVGFAPTLTARVRLPALPDRPVSLIGTWFNRPVPLPDEGDFPTGVSHVEESWRLTGAWPDDGRTDQAVIGAGLASALGLAPGGTVEIVEPGTGEGAAAGGPAAEAGAHRILTVTGIVATGGAEDRALLVPLALTQELLGRPGAVESVRVSALTVPEDERSRRARSEPDRLDSLEYDRWYCTAYVSTIARQIEEAIPNSLARPVWRVAASEGVIIERIELLMLVVAVAAFVAAGIGMSSVMGALVLERRREIALMKALGAEDHQVQGVFLVEATVLGIIGGLAGTLLGVAVAGVIGWHAFGAAVGFHPVVVPVVTVLTVLVALTGTALPCRMIGRLSPAQVLHGRG